jgi:hypothetical protein
MLVNSGESKVSYFVLLFFLFCLFVFPNIATVQNCYTTCSVTGSGTVGGIVGQNYGTTVKNCYVTGNISGGANNIFGRYGNGVVGWGGGSSDPDTIKNCVVLSRTTSGYRVGSANTLSNNYGIKSSVNYTSDINGVDGADVESSDCYSQDWWTNKSNWDSEYWDFTNVWEWDDDENLPKLREKDF